MTGRTEHRWAVDSIQEGVARIEEDGERFISVPVDVLPPGTKAGHLLRVSKPAGLASDSRGSGLTIVADERGTNAARQQSKAVVDATLAESRKRDPGGDVAL
ncbi:MAG: hypothetical protein ABJE47_00445 [bacterium]